MSKSVRHIEKDLERLWRLLHAHTLNLDDLRQRALVLVSPTPDPGFQAGTVTTMDNRVSVVSPDIGANLVMPSPALVRGVCPGLSPQAVEASQWNYVKVRCPDPTILMPRTDRISQVGTLTGINYVVAGTFAPGVPFIITSIKYYSGTYAGNGWAYFDTQVVPPTIIAQAAWGSDLLCDGLAQLSRGGTTNTKAGYVLGWTDPDYATAAGSYWFGTELVLIPLQPDLSFSYPISFLASHWEGEEFNSPWIPWEGPGGVLWQVDSSGTITTKKMSGAVEGEVAGVYGQVHSSVYPSKSDYPCAKEGDPYVYQPDEGNVTLGYIMVHDGADWISGTSEVLQEVHTIWEDWITQWDMSADVPELWKADNDYFWSGEEDNNETEYVVQYLNTPENYYPIDSSGSPPSPIVGNASDVIVFTVKMEAGGGPETDTLTGCWVEVTWEPYALGLDG